MALPVKFYIQTSVHDDPLILDNVTSYKRGHWYKYNSTYRDTWEADGSVSVVASGGSPTETEVAAIGKPGTAPSANPDPSELLYTANDEQAHVPPRFHKVLCSGYIFALNAETIPEPVDPISRSFAFTAATTDVCTATANGSANGDLYTASTTNTLPAGLSSLVVYQFVRIDANTFKLMNYSTGAIVDITDTGTGTHTLTLIQPATLPANTIGLVFVPDERDPGLSTSDPRE